MTRSTRSSRAGRAALIGAAALGLVATSVVVSPAFAEAAPDPTLNTRDYTGDGTTDVLTVTEGGALGMYTGTGRGGWEPNVLVGSGWSGYTLVTPGDFNRDGRSDLISVAPDGKLYFYAGNGSGFSGRTQIGHGWDIMAEVFSPGDFSGDGIADVLGVTTSGDLRVYYGTGTGRVSGSAKIGHGWGVFTDVSPGGDINGDGRADIVARDDAGRLYAYYGTGNGGMSRATRIGTGWGPYGQLGSIGDFTGDGNTDLYTVNTRTGEALVYPGNGASGFTPRVTLGTDWQNPASRAQAAPAPAAPTPAAPTGDFAYERDQLFRKLGDLRASRGLRPLAGSAELNARAQAWAKHMAETQNMYHTPDFRAQMTAAGWSYKSELIVRHTGGARMNVDDVLSFMHDWWVASPGHYPWMVSPNYTHVGHGYYMGPGGPYAVTVLGGR